MAIGKILQSGGYWALRNYRVIIFAVKYGSQGYVILKAVNYSRKLKKLREQYVQKHQEEAKRAAKGILNQIETILEENKVSEKEEKELKKILKENSAWVLS